MEHIFNGFLVDTTSLVGDLDSDVMMTLGNQDINVWNLLRVLMVLHRCSHAVLEYLEEHVVQMSGDVDKVNLRRIHVNLFAHKLSILKGFLSDSSRIAFWLNSTLFTWVIIWVPRRTKEPLMM